MRSFLVECGGEGDSVLAGWSVKLCVRPAGGKAGLSCPLDQVASPHPPPSPDPTQVSGDYFLYYSATGRVFRSRAEAAQQ